MRDVDLKSWTNEIKKTSPKNYYGALRWPTSTNSEEIERQKRGPLARRPLLLPPKGDSDS